MEMRWLLLLFFIGFVHCRKLPTPLDKNANTAFINMEGGSAPKAGAGAKPSALQPAPVPKSSQPTPAPLFPNTAEGNINKAALAQDGPSKSSASAQSTPAPAKTTTKPTALAQVPTKPTPAPTPAKTTPASATAGKPTTPGSGSVKQLINYYDSQGKGSPIRPYSYSQAVKQGK